MKAINPRDFEFLRNIHGRFPSSTSQRQSEWLGIFLFWGVFPLFWVVFFFARWPVVLDKNHFTVAAFAFGTFIAGVYLWKMRAVEYEFTGDYIIERRAGRIKNQLHIADILETRVNISPHQLIIKTSSSRMTVQIVPSLNEVFQKKAAETIATKNEAERQHFEAVQQATISQFKRANIIGAIILTLLGIGIALFFGWLKQRH